MSAHRQPRERKRSVLAAHKAVKYCFFPGPIEFENDSAGVTTIAIGIGTAEVGSSV